MITQLKILVFSIEEGVDRYNTFVALNDENTFYSANIGDSVKNFDMFLGEQFLKLLGFEMSFSPLKFSSIRKTEDLAIYYYTSIPKDTFTKEGFKWVNINELCFDKKDGEPGVKLSLDDYLAVYSALGSGFEGS